MFSTVFYDQKCKKTLGSLTNVLFGKVLEVESFLVWLPVAIIEVPDDASLSHSSLFSFRVSSSPRKKWRQKVFSTFSFLFENSGNGGRDL